MSYITNILYNNIIPSSKCKRMMIILFVSLNNKNIKKLFFMDTQEHLTCVCLIKRAQDHDVVQVNNKI